MDVFLKMKHWQVFSWVILMPVFLATILTVIFMSSFHISRFDHFDPFLISVPMITVLSLLMLCFWTYSVGVKLLDKMGLAAEKQTMYFKLVMLIQALYVIYAGYNAIQIISNLPDLDVNNAGVIVGGILTIFCCLYVIYYVLTKTQKSTSFKTIITILAMYMAYLDYSTVIMTYNSSDVTIGNIVSIESIMQILSTFCLFYAVYVIARALKSIEAQEESAKPKGFIEEMILIYAFPLGIWLIQPRINKIFD